MEKVKEIELQHHLIQAKNMFASNEGLPVAEDPVRYKRKESAYAFAR